MIKFLRNFHVSSRQKVLPNEISPDKVFQRCPNDKKLIDNFVVIFKKNNQKSEVFCFKHWQLEDPSKLIKELF